MKKVNYLIACSSHRAPKTDASCIPGKDVLKRHMDQLRLVDTSKLSQITIIRALPLERHGKEISAEYWDINTTGLSCPVVFLDVQDAYFSYSSWVLAMRKHRREFDYYIMIEDDYYPAHKDFVDILIDIHAEKLPQGGYLNSYTTDLAAVSNGICDCHTAMQNIDRPVSELAPGAQTLFGKLYFDNKMADYTDQYRTLFWGGPGLVNQSHTFGLNLTEDLINPIQFLDSNQVIH